MPPHFVEIEEKTEPWMQGMLDAFFDLDTERPAGFNLRPIPRSKIREYAVEMGFFDGDIGMFNYIIRSMDNHLLRSDKDGGDS